MIGYFPVARRGRNDGACVGLASRLAGQSCGAGFEPAEYLANGAFLWKAALLTLALVNVALQHTSRGYAQALAGGAVRLTVRLAALGSILMWLSVLVAGRWMGFV